MLLHALSSSRLSPCAFSARPTAMTLEAAFDSSALQRQKEAEAELALLECWGESPPQTLPMDTEPSAGEKRATSPEQERRNYHRRDSKGSGAGKGSGDRPARQLPRPPPRTRRTAAEPTDYNTEGMMWMMGRMLLRLEDQMAMERFQSGFVLSWPRRASIGTSSRLRRMWRLHSNTSKMASNVSCFLLKD